MQRLGEKLRKLREERGLSYRQLAAKLGVSHVHLITMESGKTLPSLPMLVKIAAFFDVSYDELLDDDVELDL
jgi:transcriptional regulator with XRE-family HTH domain